MANDEDPHRFPASVHQTPSPRPKKNNTEAAGGATDSREGAGPNSVSQWREGSWGAVAGVAGVEGGCWVAPPTKKKSEKKCEPSDTAPPSLPIPT